MVETKFKPVILIYKTNEKVAFLREIEAGIEEEGVPYIVTQLEENNLSARELAQRAAKASSLGVGIGILGDEICLQSSKLKEPIIKIHGNDRTRVREFGNNAARYVKCIPFK